MKIKIALLAATIAAFGVTSVIAAEDYHEAREGLMKKNGGAMGTLAKMVKGEADFDAAKVKEALTTLSEVGKSFPDQFPAGSETASKGSSAKIWENFEDFKAKSLKLSADADAALAAMPTDVATLGPVVNTLGGDCGSCHELYRVKD